MPTRKPPSINADFRDLLCALSDAETEFLVVGAYAVAVHGHPRATKDIDIWVKASRENAPRVMSALRQFGAPLAGVVEADFRSEGVGLQIGREPNRVDILTKISGIRFDEAWPNRLESNLDSDTRASFIGLDDLLRNKRSAARPQDLADVDALERLIGLRSKARQKKRPRNKRG